VENLRIVIIMEIKEYLINIKVELYQIQQYVKIIIKIIVLNIMEIK
jgi:hypothetical protein